MEKEQQKVSSSDPPHKKDSSINLLEESTTTISSGDVNSIGAALAEKLLITQQEEEQQRDKTINKVDAMTEEALPGSGSQTPLASSNTSTAVRGATPEEQKTSEFSTANAEGRKNGMITPPVQQSSFSQRRTPVSGSRSDAAANNSISNNSKTSTSSRNSRKLNQSSSRRTTSSRRSNSNTNTQPSLVPRLNGMDNLSGLVVDAKGRGEDMAYHHATTDAGMSMSHVAWLQALSLDLKQHLDKTMADMREQSRRDFERVLIVLQQESAKRTALEQRLHSQLLLQSETMVAMELKLLRLEAKVESRDMALRQHRFTPRVLSRTTNEDTSAADVQRSNRSTTSEPIGAVISSGASLTSGVTAGSFLGDENEDDETNDADSNSEVGVDQNIHSEDDIDVDDDVNDHDDEDHGENESRDPIQNFASQDSTPTQGSRPMITTTLESILLNPMIGESSVQGDTIRATRGDTDGNSSLGTNMTNSTFTSTVITSATRGDVNVRRILPEEPELTEGTGEDTGTPTSRGRSALGSNIGPTIVEGGIFTSTETRPPRSRSQSPLTVHSSAVASEALSTASASVGTSIRSSAAVASARSFQRHSRVVAAAAAAGVVSESRPLANRVVSFNTDILNLAHNQYSEAGDSITMPDELDNLSEVADTFAHSARVWREEYEARLDALQKRWATE